MANDHYISRFLTQPWEVGQRRLHFYDFESGRFDEQSSASLFATEGLHSKKTGDRFNELIESPVSSYRAALLRGDPNARSQPNGDWKLYRALVALIRLQAQRHLDMYLPEQRSHTLDDVIAKGEPLLDLIATEDRKKHVLIQVELPPGHNPLFFPEGVYFPIPLIGTAPILAVPVTPRVFIALPEKDFDLANDLTDWLKVPEIPSALSIGLGGVGGVGIANRLIIPPELHPSLTTNGLGLQQMICTQRELAARLFNRFAAANEAIGFRAFRFTGNG